MIGKANPWTKENAKELRKNGAILFFSTTANMLYAREGENWIALGHVVPLSDPPWNEPIPKIAGKPYGSKARLVGFPD